MSELDKAISELVSAFQEIMPSAQVFVAQPKPEVKPNSKASGLSPEAEYWRQKYMNTLDKYNTLLAEQSSAVEKNAALQKENDAYEALFRVLAETLREYDPKVKS